MLKKNSNKYKLTQRLMHWYKKDLTTFISDNDLLIREYVFDKHTQ